MKPKIYHFVQIDRCNMCGAPTDDAKVLGIRLNCSQGRKPRNKTGIGVSVCRCSSCGLHFPQPMPIPNSMSDHYAVSPESYWTPSYFQLTPNYFQRQIAEAKELLAFVPGMTALDIGAGIGKASVAMKNAGFSVWAIEPSEPFFRKALEFTGMGSDRLQMASIENAQLPSAFFDFITFGAVLEHLYDPAGSIEKALQWLKPGGVIQIEVPSSHHLVARLVNAFFRTAGTNYVTNLSPMHAPYHLHEFTLRSFEVHGQRVGYEIAHHHIDVATIRHVPSFVRPALRTLMEYAGSGQQLTVWLHTR